MGTIKVWLIFGETLIVICFCLDFCFAFSDTGVTREARGKLWTNRSVFNTVLQIKRHKVCESGLAVYTFTKFLKAGKNSS